MNDVTIQGGPRGIYKVFSVMALLVVFSLFLYQPEVIIEEIKSIFTVTLLEFYVPLLSVLFLIVFSLMIIGPFIFFYKISQGRFRFKDIHSKYDVDLSEIESYGYRIHDTGAGNSGQRFYLCFYLKNNKIIEVSTSWTNLDLLENFAEKNFPKKDLKIRTF